ncbi:DB module [Ancylostoma duodenale]|uniref:DB module n=1 Tax=Ancylostoma duodenale TaxID=51022 RepID=A0A0C2G7J2_9BILA|nr:DB module [Ancylostoma duodenale]
MKNAKRDGNQKFKACCARQKTADKECKRKFCDFNAINQNNMLHFLNMCSPRGGTAKLMWDCASSRHDHLECCKEKNVLPSCMQYCESSHSVPPDYLNHLVCLQNFDAIRDCFRDHLEKNPNIFGDN